MFKHGTDPPILEDLKYTVSLAVSHSTVALERAELFEQTLQSAHQSSMLYSIAAEVQTSLDPSTVVQMTVNGALEAVPIQSCEVYLFDDDHKRMRLSGRAIAPGVEEAPASLNWPQAKNHPLLKGPAVVNLRTNPMLLEVLHSPGLVVGDFDDVGPDSTDGQVPPGASTHQVLRKNEDGPAVVLGRLM